MRCCAVQCGLVWCVRYDALPCSDVCCLVVSVWVCARAAVGRAPREGRAAEGSSALSGAPGASPGMLAGPEHAASRALVPAYPAPTQPPMNHLLLARPPLARRTFTACSPLESLCGGTTGTRRTATFPSTCRAPAAWPSRAWATWQVRRRGQRAPAAGLCHRHGAQPGRPAA